VDVDEGEFLFSFVQEPHYAHGSLLFIEEEDKWLDSSNLPACFYMFALCNILRILNIFLS